MSTRPTLSVKLTAAEFKNYYYLKEELTDFCRKFGLPTSGGKLELTDRIAHYLDTGEILSAQKKPQKNSRKLPDGKPIQTDTLIEEHFVCSETHRAFFKENIGSSFSFNVAFQKWLKSNAGKTYGQAIEAYSQILEEKKKGGTTIDRQFEYNTYIRDFFADNQGKSLEQAIQCWKYKKSLQGHNRYEKTDLACIKASESQRKD